MTTDNTKPISDKNKTQEIVHGSIKVPKLFRKIDWLALLLAFGAVWIVYFLTLAPELTLEDSGELCTGSFYAGIPHPPGYPFWAIYSWLWTVLLPVGNIAWRVEVGEATAAAMACGIVAMMVSRGSSMLIEGIEDLKGMTGKWEGWICLICGTVAGISLGFGATMWSESVAINRISLFGAPWVMTVLLCLLRWIYAPQQRRYLYLAMFFFGICATIHQTLLVAAMGIEVMVALAHPRIGRFFFLGNTIIFLGGLIAHITHITTALDTADMLLYIFFTVGVCSIAAYIWLGITTRETFNEFLLDCSLIGFGLFSVMAVSYGAICAFLAVVCLCIFIWQAFQTWKFGHEWTTAIICGALWILGASFYLYEPISGMTNPPMEWGYPRTVEGFWHALNRGQYEKANPTDLFGDPGRFLNQLWFLVNGIAGEYNWILLFIIIIPFIFFIRMQKRERTWIVGLASTYVCIGLLLVIIMNPGADKQSVDLHRVFFASSHGVIAVLFGYGLALICAYMATNYQKFRIWGLVGGGFAIFITIIDKILEGDHGILPGVSLWILIGLPTVFVLSLLAYKQRAPLAITLALFCVMPICSGISHWGSSEQRDHWFGYWFGHDMFTPPYKIYPEMTKDAVLFGGTDPGRFCPTYMIFCESFIPHKDQPKEDQHFDRRDVYIITQNALADPTYLDYIRAQYNRSTQIDPPFFQELLRPGKEREQNYTTNFLARLAYQYLDVPLTRFGKNVETRRRAEGVYPPKEIYTPTPDDSSRCFSEYMSDAKTRLDHDLAYPNEPKQIKPGEEVHQNPGDNRVSVSGQVAVMSINGLLTKVIFDHNPNNEFFVEESFPLDWMYPYLSPFGIIMKINRQPQDELTDEMVKKDHDFWSAYSERLIGKWITYDTSVKEIADFARKLYLKRDFTGFTGNRKFIRDEVAQKSFSKLRSSIGGIYDWRLKHAKTAAEQQRMYKEADFAYRQSFAYCPYSPEAVFRYITLLMSLNRVDDALIVATTCADLDPNNDQIRGLVKQLKDIQNQQLQQQPKGNVQDLEKKVKDEPDNFQAGFNLASYYVQQHQNDKATQIFDQMLANSKVDSGAVVTLARYYAQMSNFPKLEAALRKLTQLEPHSPEAWCDLAAMEAALGKNSDAIKDLETSASENAARLAKDSKAPNILTNIKADPRFSPLHSSAEYKKLVSK